MIITPPPRGYDRQFRQEIAHHLLQAALRAVDPKETIRRYVRLRGHDLKIGERAYDLHQYRRIMVVGAGKATAPMAQALEEMLGDWLSGGIINVKYGYIAPTSKIELNEAGHPIPDEKGVAGTKCIADLVRSAGRDDLVICLLSGGGSALLTLPSEGISLADKQRLTELLLRSGATINEINTVRKHLSQLKGGGLASLAYPAQVISLILSDVIGNSLDVIASGPTVADPTTFQEAYAVLEAYKLVDEVSRPVVAHLLAGCRGLTPDTPKPGDAIFTRVYNLVIGGNDSAARAAMKEAIDGGFNTLLLSTYVEGEAREVANVFAAIAKEIHFSGGPLARPACVIAGGETTVTVKGDGLGGRNQELALAAAIKIDGLEDVTIISVATDGTDGPTDASGAIADGTTLRRARGLGLKAVDYLVNNDSYHFFQRLGDLIITGPTNTNVNDLIFVFVV
ncbi:MAG: glycerate kinase [Chloroflexi bacterium]|nr:glycerate kinase [Chloroflexota bacterium]MCL5074797.1 glycerate kinase [Chloroflexota bacterium]